MVVNEVQNWFSQPANDRWLLIFDNIDRDYSPELLPTVRVEDYFPSDDHSSILLSDELTVIRTASLLA